MTTLVECNCNVRERLKEGGTMLTMCHHSAHPDIMEATGNLYQMLSDLGDHLDIEELLTRPVNEAIEYYMRTTVGADYPMLNQTERDILTTGFLRHYSIALQAMLGETLNGIKTREQG